MRIVQLHAENVKRLKAIDIRPTEDLVVIAGRNAQGKTSILDAIAWTLGGASLFSDSPDPIRHGQKQATAKVDLGEMIVTRTWSAGGTTKLTVTAKDGTKFTSPQAMLDKLIGSLSFDPLAFANTDAKTQRRTLLGLVELPFDLDELDRRRASIFEERTTANRDLKKLANALSLLDRPVKVEGPVVDISEAMAALRAGTEVKAENDRHRLRVREAENQVQAATFQVESLRRQLAEAEARLEEAVGEHERREEALAFLPDDPDLDALQVAVTDADRQKDAVRLAAEYTEREQQVADAQAEADQLTALLEQIDVEKIEGLKAAKMPAPGLSVSDDGVLFNEVPLAQCSGAERLRVSLAIAMAANPELRVIRIADGSLLDDDSLELVAEMAAFADFQVWVERVGDRDEMAIVIEDGMVLS